MTTSGVTLIAALYINSGREREFNEFEAAAAGIMRRYGGAIERRIRIAPVADQNLPYEVHVVTFRDDHAFEQYRADPDLQALSDLRAVAIRQTTVWRGCDLPHFT